MLCGDDALTLGMMACGARGVISVASNVVPAAVQGVVTAFLQGDVAGARRQQQALLGVYDAMFVETNPGPVKAALAWMGKIPAEIRLPMAWPTEASIAKTVAALKAYGLQGG